MADTPDTPTSTATPAPTPRRRAPRKTATPKAAAKSTAAKKPTATKTAASAGPTKVAVKPRAKTATPRAATAAPRKSAHKPASSSAAPKSSLAKATDKVGGKWGAAAIAGGVAAIGAAATAALLSLRGSTPKTDQPKKGGAHTPDGKDASASFKAGIADENTIPDKK